MKKTVIKETKRLLILLGATGLLGGIGIVMNGTPVTAQAATTTTQTQGILHSGDFGTSHWYISDDLTLHIGAGKFANLSNSQSAPPWTAYGDQVAKIVIEGPVTLAPNSRELFGYLGATSIEGLDQIDASHVTNFEFAFFGIQVPNLDLTSWDVHNVTDAGFMFMRAQSDVINLSGWQMPKLKLAQWMFMLAPRVHELDLAGINFRNADATRALMNMNLTVIHLGPDSLLTGTNLQPFHNDAYQDMWQDIGDGTTEAPTGKNRYTYSQLMAEFKGAAPYTYVRAKNPGQPVTVQYLDQLNQALVKADTLTGYYGDTFTAQAKTFAGYHVTSVDGEPTGTFGSRPYTVTYHYAVDEKNQQSLLGEDATITVGDPAPTSETFKAKATDKDGQALPVVVDLSQATLNQPGRYPVTLTTRDGQSKAVTLTVKAADESSSSSSSSSIDRSHSSSTPTSSSNSDDSLSSGDLISGGDTDLAVFKGQAVYATKAVRLYQRPTFKASQVRARYAKQSRTKRPMFVVIGSAHSKHHALRFKVRDVNHHSKTAGKVGYITAKKAYVTNVYYQRTYTRVTVINPQGVNGYRTRKLTGKTRHYRRGQTLRVKRLVRYHLTTRYVLTNGRYVTTNKKLVKVQQNSVQQSTQHSAAVTTRTIK